MKLHRLRPCLPAITAVLCGGVAGMILQLPLLNIPFAFGLHWLMPLLQGLADYLYTISAQFLLPGLIKGLLSAPKAVVVAGLIAWCMLALRRPRLVFYSAFIWPALVQLHYWINVLQLQQAVQRLGLPSDRSSLPLDLAFPARAFEMLVQYSLFAVCVFAFYHVSRRRQASPPVTSTGD